MAKPKLLKKGYADRISRLDFSSRHYRGAQFPSDMFYVGVANRLLPELKKWLDGFPDLRLSHIRRLALNLVSYIEDLVSGSGIWEAFLSLHRKKYGREMPFYDTDDEMYSREYPCPQAVRFLIWYTLNDVSPETMLNPKNPAIEFVANALMPELLKAYDDAPDSPGRPELLSEEKLPVPLFYQIRNICDWLCRNCYLTAVADSQEVAEQFIDFFAPVLENMDASESQIQYAAASYLPFNTLIGPLGVTAQEWLSEIISLYPEDEEREFLGILAEIKSLPLKAYIYKSVNKERNRAVLADLDGKEYELSAYTMPDETLPENVAANSSAFMSLVFFNGAWNLNSIGMQGLPPDFYNSLLAKYKDRREADADKYVHLMKRLKNKPLGTAANFDELKTILGLPDQETTDKQNDIMGQRNFLYFVNSNSDISILPHYGTAVKFRGNKLYDKKEAVTNGLALILNPDLTSKELRDYIISNNLVPDAALNSFTSPADGHRLFQENLRFFADYARRDTPLCASVESAFLE